MIMSRIRLLVLIAGALGLLGASALVVPARAAAERNLTEALAYRVELHRTGGYLGVDDYFVAYRGEPGSETLFEIVDGAEFQSLNGSYLPKYRCCDRFMYQLKVWYADREVKAITTMDGGDAPDVLWKVIHLLTTTPR